MYFVGLDVGTSGSKCAVFNKKGEEIAFEYQAYQSFSKKTGYYELNPKVILKSAFDVIRRAVSNVNINKLYIAISSFGESFVCLDKYDNPLFNTILCSDIRGSEQLSYILKKMDKKEIMDITGIPAHPMYSAIKLLWLKQNSPKIFEKTKKILLIADYVAYMLTGEAVTDFSLASRTMLFNPIKKKWEDKILKETNIDKELLPNTVKSGTLIGKITKKAAAELNLPLDTYIVVGAHDQSCAALGAGATKEGIILCGMGTAMCLSLPFDKPIITYSMMQNNYNCGIHAFPNKYISLAFTFSGCSLINWFIENFAKNLKADAQKENKSIYKYLEDNTYPNPTKILVFPHFSGAGTPKMDTNATGLISGLTLSTKYNELYRALLEGTIYEMRYNLELMNKSGIKYNTVRAVGGGSKSKLWLQIMSDILDCSIETMEYGEAGILGAVMCAGVAGKLFLDFEEAVNLLVKTRKIYMQNNENCKIYNSQYKKFKNLYQNKEF